MSRRKGQIVPAATATGGLSSGYAFFMEDIWLIVSDYREMAQYWRGQGGEFLSQSFQTQGPSQYSLVW